MPIIHNPRDMHSRLVFLLNELSAGCDPDFDTAYDDLDREFAELRFCFGNA